ncbi:MAG: hypothetical protein JW908_00540 [Anaerolineales bacterium]|nr:hypothetical protein [Anaerolineales bacterium]
MGDTPITNPRSPIRIVCSLPGHENDYLMFKADGWKYKHLRQWEDAAGASHIAEIVSERIESWRLTVDNIEIEFKPGIEAFDELPPDIAGWVTVSYREAYNKAGLPSPN